MAPLRGKTGIARFLERRGGGLHHLCFESDDVTRDLKRLGTTGVELIDTRPRPGLAGLVGFVHPRSCAGILVELATPVDHNPEPPAPLALTTVHATVGDVSLAVEAYRNLFDLALALASPDGSIAQLALSGVTVQLASGRRTHGQPGLSALRLAVSDGGGLARRLDAGGVAYQVSGDGLVLAPGATGGVPLIIRQSHT